MSARAAIESVADTALWMAAVSYFSNDEIASLAKELLALPSAAFWIQDFECAAEGDESKNTRLERSRSRSGLVAIAVFSCHEPKRHKRSGDHRCAPGGGVRGAMRCRALARMDADHDQRSAAGSRTVRRRQQRSGSPAQIAARGLEGHRTRSSA